MMSRPIVAAALVGVLALAGCANANVKATPLPLRVAFDVNDAGIVVGSTGDPDESLGQAWMIDLATGERRELNVPIDASEYVEVTGLAINRTGTAVGTASFYSFRWRLGTGEVQSLNPLLDGGGSVVSDVNDAGLVVGQSGTSATAWGPDNQPRRLPTLGGSQARAYEVNTHGVAVGTSSTADTSYDHAVSWDVAAGTVRRLQEPTGATWSEALAINDAGDIVGIVGYDAGAWSTQMARWDAATGQVRLIGPRGTYGNGVVRPAAVNNRGIVVGDKGHTTFNPSGIGLDTNAARVDLSTGATIDLAPRTSHATGINDNGLMVGWVWNDSADRVATHWTLTR